MVLGHRDAEKDGARVAISFPSGANNPLLSGEKSEPETASVSSGVSGAGGADYRLLVLVLKGGARWPKKELSDRKRRSRK